MNKEAANRILPEHDRNDLYMEKLPANEEELQKQLDELKPKINNFLYEWLPPTASIQQMEELGCAIFYRIFRIWEDEMRKKKLE